MSVTFRPATAADTEVAVPLLYSSGPDVFDYVFAHPRRGSALDFLGHAFPNGAGEFGHRNHTVVLMDGRIVGIGAAFGARRAYRSALGTGRQILTFYGWRHVVEIPPGRGPVRRRSARGPCPAPGSIRRGGFRCPGCASPEQGQVFQVRSLATVPDLGGEGCNARGSSRVPEAGNADNAHYVN
jgi:hypothetical protein